MTDSQASSGTTSAMQAPLWRRIIALLIDWWASWLVAYLIFRGEMHPLAPLAVFAIEYVVLLSTVGSTFGHRILGLRVTRIAKQTGADGEITVVRPTMLGGIGFKAALIRTVLVCLVIPAVIWDRDNVGMHDKAAHTRIVRG